MSDYVKKLGYLSVFSEQGCGPVLCFCDESKKGIYEITMISEENYLKVFRRDSQLNLFDSGNVLWEGRITKDLERKCKDYSFGNKGDSWTDMFRKKMRAELYEKI